MTIKTFLPHPAIQEFVACIFIAENHHDTGEEHLFSPFPPNPQNSIIFYIRDPAEIQRKTNAQIIRLPQCIFVAQHTDSINSRMGRDHLMLYIGFKPGGLYRLLGTPMNKLINEPINAKDIYGYEISLVMEQMSEAPDWKSIMVVAETFLLSRLKKLRSTESFDLAMNQLIQLDGNIGMDKVAGLACLSFRQFERKCSERIGVPPKLYARIARFSKAYRMKEIDPNLSWTSLAHDCGYFDQMHMIRDFKEFTGITPTTMDHVLKQSVHRLQTDLII